MRVPWETMRGVWCRVTRLYPRFTPATFGRASWHTKHNPNHSGVHPAEFICMMPKVKEEVGEAQYMEKSS